MRSLNWLILGTILVLTGCSDTKEVGENALSDGVETGTVSAEGLADDTAEATVRQIMTGVRNGQPVVAWNALPAAYQKDVNELVRTFGSNMDADVWKQVTAVLQSVQQLLTDKQEFILNHPAIAEGQDPEAAAKGVVQVAGLLKAILNGVGDLEALKTFDGAQFMQTTGADVVTQLTSLAKLAPKDGAVQVSLFEEALVETVESTDTTATLKLTGSGGDEQLREFVKHDGKWLPKDMVDDWDRKMAEAREGLKALPAQSAQLKGQAMMYGGMVMGMLSPLQNATTQEQFNQAAGGLMATAGMFMGGGSSFGGEAPPDGSNAPEDSPSNPKPLPVPAE
ncbi:MAG: hypothetical protein R3C59_19940 [Planctomycetaceae bacterium]